MSPRPTTTPWSGPSYRAASIVLDRPHPPTTSWWIGLSREAFQRAAQDRRPHMQLAKEAVTVRNGHER